MKACETCQKVLGPRNKSGHCTPCGNRARWENPAYRQRHSAGIRNKIASDPEYRVAMGERARKINADPASVERRTRHFSKMRIWEIGNAAQPKGSAARIQAGRSITEHRLRWCPPELRADYLGLLRSGFKAAEARPMIEDHHAVGMERWRRSIGIMPEPVVEPDDGPPAIDPNLPVVERAMTAAAWRLGVDLDQDLGPRHRGFAKVRWAAMTRLREQGLSFPKIGAALGLDHSTVIYGITQAGYLAKRDPVFAEALELARAA